MSEHQQQIESRTRRMLLQTGAAAVPMMITIKSVRAQVVGQPSDDMLTSIGCLANAEIPGNYQTAVDLVAQKLDLNPTSALSPEGEQKDASQIMPQASTPERPGGWIGRVLSRDLRNEGTGAGQNITTQADGIADYRNWTYENFEEYFAAGHFDFYQGATYDPASQYHNTFLEITMSSACWNSIESQTT